MNSEKSFPAAAARGRLILLCVDGSPSAEACVDHAIWLAKDLPGEIVILHVLGRGDGSRSGDAAMEEARRYVDRLRGRVAEATGAKTSVRLETGRAADRILESARELMPDVVVIGSAEVDSLHGVVGRNAQRILVQLRTSLLVARSSAGREATPPKRLLVPLDGSARAEGALSTAARIATAHGAEIVLVHVVAEPHAVALLDVSGARSIARELTTHLQRGATAYLESLRSELAKTGAVVRVLVARDVNERQRLLEISQKEEADLIVLCAHGYAYDSGLAFGSVSGFLLSHSTVPLLVLQNVLGAEIHPFGTPPERVVAPASSASTAYATNL